MNLKKLMGRQYVKQHIYDSASQISMSEFCSITKWDNRYDSGDGSINYSGSEQLRFIDLQFFNEQWVYGPRIVWRGTRNIMSFPMIAQKGKDAVVINNEDELGEYAELWRNNDFSMMNRHVETDVYKSNKKSYIDFINEINGIIANDWNIVYVNIYEDERACKFYKVI